MTAPGVGADGIAFATAAGTATTAACTATSAVSAARSARCFRQGVAHIAQYFPPLLEEAHAPHSQLEAEEEEAMIRGLWVLVVMVVWGVVCAGLCVLSASVVLLGLRAEVHQKSSNHGILGIAKKLLMR
jgi:hypothetical protein